MSRWILTALVLALSLAPLVAAEEAAEEQGSVDSEAWAVEPLLDMLVRPLEEGKIDRSSLWEIARALAEIGDPRAIPTMIGVIDADNSYDTVYGVGYFGLSRLTGVEYSSLHDGAWWRRWWEQNKSSYSAEVRQIPIPDVPKTEHGKAYTPFLADRDALLDDLLTRLVREIRAAEDGQLDPLAVSDLVSRIAETEDPRAVPTLIGVIDADNSRDTVYTVGHYGLGRLTEVKYSVFHDGAWWRRWWARNMSSFPEEVQQIPIPDLPKTKAGRHYVYYPQEVDSLQGKIAGLRQYLERGGSRGGLWVIAEEIAELGDPAAIPLLIGLIDADNTYDTVYGVGYFGLRHLTDVQYSDDHDGAWWRQWWEENRSQYREEVQQMAIPDLRDLVVSWRDQREGRERARALQDVAHVPAQDLLAAGDKDKRYLLVGNGPDVGAPSDGYRLLVMLPGGDGGPDFHPFVRRIYKQALSEQYLIAQPVAKEWSDGQFKQVVWPTRTHTWSEMRFSTEEFVEAVVEDVQQRYRLDPKFVFTLGWSSGGPPCYALSLQEKKSVTGTFIAMSVFKPDELPPLNSVKGHAYYILHSPEDFIPIRMAEQARDALRELGATVKLRTYSGGHGWHGDVYGTIRTGIQWLEKQVR